MIHNHWPLTQIPPAGSWTLTVPRRSCIGCWRLSSPAGGRGRLRGRRGLKDAVCRQRPRRRQRAQLPGPHRGRRGRFHFARGWAVHGQDDGHETVQPALGHHVSPNPGAKNVNDAIVNHYVPSDFKCFFCFCLFFTGRSWWSSSRRRERRRRDSARTWKSSRTSSSDKTEGKKKTFGSLPVLLFHGQFTRRHLYQRNNTVLTVTRLTDCGLVAIETCRRRTAPHWRRSTASTSTSKPNCVCWRSSSAKETQQSSSESRSHKQDEDRSRFPSLLISFYYLARRDESVNPIHWALMSINGFLARRRPRRHPLLSKESQDFCSQYLITHTLAQITIFAADGLFLSECF